MLIIVTMKLIAATVEEIPVRIKPKIQKSTPWVGLYVADSHRRRSLTMANASTFVAALKHYVYMASFHLVIPQWTLLGVAPLWRLQSLWTCVEPGDDNVQMPVEAVLATGATLLAMGRWREGLTVLSWVPDAPEGG